MSEEQPKGWQEPLNDISNTGLVSPRTVEIYRANLMTKMAANSLSDLVRMAMMAGILEKSGKRAR